MSQTEPARRITLDQVVAHNLRRARRLRDWTQLQAAEQLEPYLGERWSPAVFSAAERSFEGARIREFTASQVLAFALAFDLPFPWFYLPPSLDSQIHPRGSDATVSGEFLVRSLLAAPGGTPADQIRADALLRRMQDLTPNGSLGEALDRENQILIVNLRARYQAAMKGWHRESALLKQVIDLAGTYVHPEYGELLQEKINDVLSDPRVADALARTERVYDVASEEDFREFLRQHDPERLADWDRERTETRDARGESGAEE